MGQTGLPAPIELRLRDVHVRAWLAAMQETAFHVVRGDIHNGRLRLFSAVSREGLVILDWCNAEITIRVPGEADARCVDTIQSALDVLDAMLEDHVAAEARASQPALTETAANHQTGACEATNSMPACADAICFASE